MAQGGPGGLLGPDGTRFRGLSPGKATGQQGSVNLLGLLSKLFYALAAAVLMLLSLALMAVAGWQLMTAILTGESLLHPTLASIGLVTIAIAVYEVGKFLVEEELIHESERRSMVEARRSLTKFFTIIIITLSLEAIVLVFETKLERISDLIYPTGLMAVAVAAMVGLGLFLWLSAERGGGQHGTGAPP